MSERNITIKDLAKQLGLSKSTVSRAFHDREDINPATREKVLRLAKQMDYQPNMLARGLKKRMTYTVGVIIPGYMIPFYSEAISGIEDTLAAGGFSVMTCQSNESYEKEVENVGMLMRNRVDGLIISLSRETVSLDHLARLKEKAVPLVLFNRVSPALDVSQVFVDDYQGACDMVTYMIGRGRRRIAHLSGPKGLIMSMQREKGYRDALRQGGIGVDESLITEGDFSMDSGAKLIKRLLDMNEPPDAVFAVCDAMAFGVIRELRQRGIRVPSDISVGGFTDEPVAGLVNPGLTTVRQPIYDIGATAARLLLEQLKGDMAVRKERLSTELIIRDSV